MFLHLGYQVFADDRQEFTLTVYHRDLVAELVLHKDAGHLLLNQGSKVIRTKGLGQVHDACSVFGGHVVTCHYRKGRVWEGQTWDWEQLLVFPANHAFSFKLFQYLVGNQFVSSAIVFQWEFGGFRRKVGCYPCFRQNHIYPQVGVGIEGADLYVV